MFEDLKRKALDTILGQHPSIVGNLVRGNPWNLNTMFGNIQSPLANSTKLGTSPDVKLPKQVPDRSAQPLHFTLPHLVLPNLPHFQMPNLAPQHVMARGNYVSPLPRYTPTPTATPTPAPMPNMNELERRTLPTFQQYGIHPAVAFGTAQAEGGRIGTNNKWNINAIDSNPGLAYDYPSLEAAATSAAQLMQNLINKYHGGSTPEGQLRALVTHFAGDPATWKQRSIATGGAGKYFDSWDQFVKATNAYKKWMNYGN